MTTSLRLDSFEIAERMEVATFIGRQSTAGADGTCLEFTAKIERFNGQGPWTASVVFDGCEGNSPQDALLRLANWCGRAAQALDQDEAWGDDSLPLGKGSL